jgi:hypothetical protein
MPASPTNPGVHSVTGIATSIAAFVGWAGQGPISSPVGTPTPTSVIGGNAENWNYYFPCVVTSDPLVGNRPTPFPPYGFQAGTYAATGGNRGGWKAPAGVQDGAPLPQSSCARWE